MFCPNGHPYQQTHSNGVAQCLECRETARIVLGCPICRVGLCGTCALRAPRGPRPQQSGSMGDPNISVQPPENAVCEEGHLLALAFHQCVWGCDACRTQHQPGSLRSLRCDKCDYDRCQNCWPAAPTRKQSSPNTAQGGPSNHQPFPQPHQQQQASLPSPPAHRPPPEQQQSTQQQPDVGITHCPKGHNLHVKLHTSGWYCDGCKQNFGSSSRRSLRCDECDYDVCDHCFFHGPGKLGGSMNSSNSGTHPSNTAPPPPAHHPQHHQQQHHHPPAPHSRPHTGGIGGQHHHQQPQQQPPPFQHSHHSSGSFHQQQHHHFQPQAHSAPHHHPQHQQQHSPTAPTQQGIPQNLTCSKGHPLAQMRHQQQWGCDVCRSTHAANSLSSMRCGTCDYDICELCARRQQPPASAPPPPSSAPQAPPGAFIPKCRVGHVLRQTTHKRSWRCDGCLRTLSSGWEASMHCSSCNYDLCSRCVRPPANKTPAGPPPNPPQKKPVSSPWSNDSGSNTQTQQQQPGGPPSYPHPTNSSNNNHIANPSSSAPPHHPGPIGGLAIRPPSELKLSNMKPRGRCRALFIGINYPRTGVELKGCWNDVKTMMGLLDSLHFRLNDIQILVDDPTFPGRTGHPDKDSILRAMHWLAHGAQSGDSLFLHYSGHGSQLKDQDGDEDDGFDETMVPADYQTAGQIRDDDIHAVVCKPLPPGARLTSVMDCCHSGTLMDLEYMWVHDATQVTPKRKRTGNINSFINPNRSRGFQIASPKHCEAEIVLFSGCKDTQTSADVKNTNTFQHDLNDPGTAGGACTNAMAEIITTQLKTQGRMEMTYVQLLREMQRNLHSRKFTQVPQMSTSRPIDIEDYFSLFGPL